jgi:nucleotide-binding universal stress UspA family protein
MLPFKRVLFPIDYSDHCQSIIPYVRDTVKHFSATLTVIHAFGALASHFSELDLADPSWAEDIRRLEEQRLRKFVAETFPGQRVEALLREGEAGDVIDSVVRHQGTDLVMMPTHGRGPVRRMLLGSVTAKVLHDVSSAVWTSAARAGDGHLGDTSYKSILCAVDLSDESEAVLRAAAALAASYEARMGMVHVVELPPPSMEVDFTAFKGALLDAANERMRELKGRLGIDAPHKCLDSMTIDGVSEEASATKADLVVVGRGRSQGTLSRAWSRLYSIVRESPCPVLSI